MSSDTTWPQGRSIRNLVTRSQTSTCRRPLPPSLSDEDRCPITRRPESDTRMLAGGAFGLLFKPGRRDGRRSDDSPMLVVCVSGRGGRRLLHVDIQELKDHPCDPIRRGGGLYPRKISRDGHNCCVLTSCGLTHRGPSWPP